MTSHENPVSDDPEQKRSILKPLFTLPIALVAVTLGILLVTNTVSAWGHRDEEFSVLSIQQARYLGDIEKGIEGE